MGEIAEMMLDGTLCACCGEYMGSSNDFPTYCGGCAPDFETPPSKFDRPISRKKVRCDICGKGVKKTGLAMHKAAKHPADLMPTQKDKT